MWTPELSTPLEAEHGCASSYPSLLLPEAPSPENWHNSGPSQPAIAPKCCGVRARPISVVLLCSSAPTAVWPFLPEHTRSSRHHELISPNSWHFPWSSLGCSGRLATETGHRQRIRPIWAGRPLMTKRVHV